LRNVIHKSTTTTTWPAIQIHLHFTLLLTTTLPSRAATKVLPISSCQSMAQHGGKDVRRVKVICTHILRPSSGLFADSDPASNSIPVDKNLPPDLITPPNLMPWAYRENYRQQKTSRTGEDGEDCRPGFLLVITDSVLRISGRQYNHRSYIQRLAAATDTRAQSAQQMLRAVKSTVIFASK